MRRTVILFLALSLVMTACGTLEISLETPPPVIPEPLMGAAPDEIVSQELGLSLDSSSEEIRRAMLQSATNWQTIWMDGTFVGFDPAATKPPPVLREQVWIDLPTSRFRSVSGYVDGPMDKFKVSDGLTILEMNLQTGQSQSNQMPDLGPEKQFVPVYQPGYAYPQPLWAQLGTTISLLAFPSDMAQSEGVFKPLAMEFVAGRETLVVEWTYKTNDLPSWRAWLDSQTAVILKFQEFGKEGSARVQAEIVVNQVIYDAAFDNALFQAPSAPPQFTDMTGNPLTASQPAPTASSDPDPLGEVYFFIFDHNYGNEKTQLARLPASCAVGLLSCPKADVVSLPSEVDASLTALSWSPDGEMAAFAYPAAPDGDQTGLYLFDPQGPAWKSIVEFNFIDPPFWSPDGGWLAFRVQDGEGNDEIYAIRRDGSQLTNLSASEKLPVDGSPYAVSGWINNSVILHSRSLGTIYLLRPEDGSVKSLFDTPLAKSDFVTPSPDGYYLAYTDVTAQKMTLKLLTPDGNTARDLATFQEGSIYPIVWSPDSASLAFARITGNAADGQDVYVINQDGSNLRQVYHSNFGSIYMLNFSPDGKYLLLQDYDAAGWHVITINLSTLEQRMLQQVPGIPLDWWWMAPSWR